MDIHLKNEPKELVQKFSNLKTTEGLALLLEVSYDTLIYNLYRRKAPNKYRTFTIQKKSGGQRIILAPNPSLKILQRKLNYLLQLTFKHKYPVHGFVPGRSIVTNARPHVRKRFVLNIDIEDFFPSINFGRVRGMFKSWPYYFPAKVATFLAQLCCYNRALPQGAPTSPIISNIICSKLDNELLDFARKYRCTYTRYADDITLSTNEHAFRPNIAHFDYDDGKHILRIGGELEEIFSQNGFILNHAKARLLGRGSRQEVTGIVVNDKINLKRKYVKQIRAMLHSAEVNGLPFAQTLHHSNHRTRSNNPNFPPAQFANVLEGKINYLKMVKSEYCPVYRKYANKYNQIIAPKFPEYTVSIDEIFSALWVVISEDDKGESIIQGTAFNLDGYGVVTCNHVTSDKITVFKYDQESSIYSATILFQDAQRDIAILEVDSAPPSHNLISANNPSMKLRDRISVFGFPNHNTNDTPYVNDGTIAAFRKHLGRERVLVTANISAGMSGGPVLNQQNEVIGVVVVGSDEIHDISTEFRGFMPISTLHEIRTKS